MVNVWRLSSSCRSTTTQRRSPGIAFTSFALFSQIFVTAEFLPFLQPIAAGRQTCGSRDGRDVRKVLIPMTVTMVAPLGASSARPGRDDKSLMESVHATHYRPLLRFLLGLTRNQRPAAEDLLQETMLRVWRHLDSLPREEENARKWLLTIARRVAIDAARSRQARPSEVSLVEADQVSSVDSVAGALALHDLTDAFHRLSTEHRMVLQELHFRGASVEEAAQRLGIPAGTVKSRAHYALRFLRTALDPAE